MPTGYTAKLYEGEDQSFEDFALGCARAFGASILMRDDSPNKPISIDAITDNSDYHVRAIRETKAEIARIMAMTPEEIRQAARSEFRDRKESDERYKTSRAEMRQRYEDMLD